MNAFTQVPKHLIERIRVPVIVLPLPGFAALGELSDFSYSSLLIDQNEETDSHLAGQCEDQMR